MWHLSEAGTSGPCTQGLGVPFSRQKCTTDFGGPPGDSVTETKGTLAGGLFFICGGGLNLGHTLSIQRAL